jgi:hypothetical protein
MGPATAFIIAILGCGEGNAPCEQVKTLETRYESQAACTEATEAALTSQSDADFPVIVAQCVAAGSPPKAIKANEVQLPGPGKADVRTSPLHS